MIPCTNCGKKAVWSYMPGKENFCDACVPRGCTCNQEDDGTEPLDKKGRKHPCCEFNVIDEFFHRDPEIAQCGWDAYYEKHPEREKNNDN